MAMGWSIVAEKALFKAGDVIRFVRSTPAGMEYAEGEYRVHSTNGSEVIFDCDVPAGICADDFMEAVSSGNL